MNDSSDVFLVRIFGLWQLGMIMKVVNFSLNKGDWTVQTELTDTIWSKTSLSFDFLPIMVESDVMDRHKNWVLLFTLVSCQSQISLHPDVQGTTSFSRDNVVVEFVGS